MPHSTYLYLHGTEYTPFTKLGLNKHLFITSTVCYAGYFFHSHIEYLQNPSESCFISQETAKCCQVGGTAYHLGVPTFVVEHVTPGHRPLAPLQPEAKATDFWERLPGLPALNQSLMSTQGRRPASAASQLWAPGLQNCSPLQYSSAPALTHFCVFTELATFPSFRNHCGFHLSMAFYIFLEY